MKASKKRYEEFIEKIKAEIKKPALDITEFPPGEIDELNFYYCGAPSKKDKLKREEILNKYRSHYIHIQWTTGGASGGNCWNDNAPESCPMNADPEPAFEDFDRILEVVCPNITYLQYKKLATIIEFKQSRDNEYYGNYTDHAYKFINLGNLFDKLQELGLI